MKAITNAIFAAFLVLLVTQAAQASELGGKLTVKIIESNVRETHIGSLGLSGGGLDVKGRFNSGVEIVGSKVNGDVNVTIERSNVRSTHIGVAEVNRGVSIR